MLVHRKRIHAHAAEVRVERIAKFEIIQGMQRTTVAPIFGDELLDEGRAFANSFRKLGCFIIPVCSLSTPWLAA